MIRVEIKPELLSWARERAGLEIDALAHRFPKLAAWQQGTVKPTLKQIEDLAKATHTPVGFLFLQEPPVEEIPIPDFRTIRNKAISRPSPDLLDYLRLPATPGMVPRLCPLRTKLAALVRWVRKLE